MTGRRYFLFDLVRSGISWFLVGVVTILVFIPVFITFLVMVVFDRDRNCIHPLISFWARAILVVCPMMCVHLEGTEHLKRGSTYVLVANHQSVADIIAVLHLSHPFKFIAKRELFWIPFLGWALSLAGYIPLIRGDNKSGKETLDRASTYLKRGVSVLLFPEGTRSRDGEIHSFKVGAFKLARDNGVPIVPIVIYGTRDLIPKGSRLLRRRVKVTVKIGTPRLVGTSDGTSIEKFCESVRSEIITSFDEIRRRVKEMTELTSV